ncbi:MAG: phosphonate metabolism protein/1,5-bisphosphokinase (PRPP-forming) PhnN [Hyphomicrobiaceae bacterium]
MSSEVIDADPRLGPGALVLVVGPSGAGKDALLSGARSALAGDPAFVFPTRVITRHSQAAEMHHPMSEYDFVEAARLGAFALSWHAHNLRYGIPVAVDDHVRCGRNVAVNVSRTVVDAARRRYARAVVVLVDCPIRTRAERLAARGREGHDEILARLERAVDTFDHSVADVLIDNGGSLEVGIAAFIDVLKKLSRPLSPAL